MALAPRPLRLRKGPKTKRNSKNKKIFLGDEADGGVMRRKNPVDRVLRSSSLAKKVEFWKSKRDRASNKKSEVKQGVHCDTSRRKDPPQQRERQVGAVIIEERDDRSVNDWSDRA